MSNFDVTYAVYGALHAGNREWAEGYDVTSQLSSVLNAPDTAGIAQCGNNIFGDPSPNYQKHFGAVVNNLYFACQEGQTIDFNHGGGTPAGPGPGTSSHLVVKFAVYGALANGWGSYARAFDVAERLQALLNESNGVVACNNASFGDPSEGDEKHFAAVVNRGGTDFHFACAEGQTIDFNSWGVSYG